MTTQPIEMRGGGRPPSEATPIVRCEVYGTTGVGKSTFAATFPGPLWIVNFDRSWAPIIEQLPETCHIRYMEIPVDADMLVKGIAASHLLSFDRFLAEASQSKDGGTFILDGADIWWDVVKAAKLPEGGADVARDYYVPNTYATSRYRRLSSLPMHLVCVTAARNKWDSASRESDMMESEGFKHRMRWLTSQVRLFSPESRTYTPSIPRADAKPGRTFHGYIAMAKENPSLEGSVEPSLTYLTLYRKLYKRQPPDADRCWAPKWGTP